MVNKKIATALSVLCVSGLISLTAGVMSVNADVLKLKPIGKIETSHQVTLPQYPLSRLVSQLEVDTKKDVLYPAPIQDQPRGLFTWHWIEQDTDIYLSVYLPGQASLFTLTPNWYTYDGDKRFITYQKYGDIIVVGTGTDEKTATSTIATVIERYNQDCHGDYPPSTSVEAKMNPWTNNGKTDTYTVSHTVSVPLTQEPPIIDTPLIPNKETLTILANLRGLTLPSTPYPTLPSPPQRPRLTSTIHLPTVPELGIGCGWEYTKTITPEIDKDAITTEANILYHETLSNLQKQEAEYVKKLDGYTKEYEKYTQDIKPWQELWDKILTTSPNTTTEEENDNE